MSLIDLILGRNKNHWKNIPDHSPDEAILILSKSLLYEVDQLTASVEGYAVESEYCKGQRYYASVVTSTLGRILDEFSALSNTPIGDHTTLDAFALARAQLDAVTDKKGANK